MTGGGRSPVADGDAVRTPLTEVAVAGAVGAELGDEAATGAILREGIAHFIGLCKARRGGKCVNGVRPDWHVGGELQETSGRRAPAYLYMC